jgi:hypothetical protein
MGKKEPVGFVTNDKWVLQDGIMDETDEAVLKEAAAGGAPVIKMSTKQMLERMQKEKPSTFRKFRRIFEKTSGDSLTIEQIIELAAKADTRNKAYVEVFDSLMTTEQAKQIRVWRVDEYCSWRSVARRAFGKCEDWHWPRVGTPIESKLVGMALCEVAAQKLGEDYWREPWN